MIGLYNKQFRYGANQSILSLLEYNPGSSLLDLGCGDGDLTQIIGKTIGAERIIGIDYNYYRVPFNIQVEDLDNSVSMLKLSGFDVVTASHVIEHLSNTDEFVKGIYRTLKPNGYTVISTPNLASLHIIFLLLMGRQPITCSISDEIEDKWMESGPRHRRLFTAGGLVKLLEFHGFNIEKVIMSGYFPLPYHLARVACFIDRWHGNCITVKARKHEG